MASHYSMYIKKIKTTFSNGFVKSVAVLAGGTIIAQAVMILALPVLTRLYSPSDFGILAIYASLLLMLSVASGLRLEIAIPIVQRETDAVHMTCLALCSVFVVTLFIAFIFFGFSERLLLLVNKPNFAPYVWLVPIGVLASGFFMVLQYWAVRKKAFKLVAKTKMRQAISAVAVQLGIGYFFGSTFGLLVGHLISGVAGLITLLILFIGTSKGALKRISILRLRKLFFENKDLVRYSTLEAFCNTAGLQLPVVLIATFAVSSEAGFLFLATRLMAMPITLVGHATAQVFLANSGAKHQAGELANFTEATIVGLSKAGVGPLLFLGIIAPVVVPFIFGAEWVRSGTLVSWMVPWFVMQFITSPVSMVMYVTQNQRRAFFLQLAGLFLRAGSVYIASLVAIEYISEIYAISGFVFYLIYFFLIVRTVNCSLVKILTGMKLGLFIISGWVGFALIVNWILQATGANILNFFR